MSEVIDSYDLSPMQEGMLFHAVSERNSGIDMEQIVMRLQEELDLSAFVQAWCTVLDRHTILRTRFRWEDLPKPQQEVIARAELPLTQVDWSSESAESSEEEFSRHIARDRFQDFDLSRAPLMRLFVARLSQDSFRVLWTFHHALLDGRSFPIVLREVFALYDAARAGAAIELRAPIPYRHFVDWHRSRSFAAAEDYWRNALRGFYAPTPFRVDLNRPEAAEEPDAPRFDARQTRLSASVTGRLRAFASAVGVTINTLLQGAWALLLHRYSGEDDVVFGATRAGRRFDPASGQDLVGLFINSLPVRVSVDERADVATWLRELREQQRSVRDHEHTPLATAQACSCVPRGMPLFESLVVYEHNSLDAQLHALGGPWHRRRFEYIGQTNFPLALIAYGDDEMLLRLEYSRERFGDAAIERMLGHVVTLLTQFAQGSASCVRDLDMLSAAERSELLGEGTALPTFACSGTLHERFAQQVARTPEAIALTAFDAEERRLTLSYAELEARSERVAGALRARGVGANQLVGLRTERNAELVIGLLGILKAGGAYLPLDPVYPAERIRFMLEDAGVRIVLTQRSLSADLAGGSVDVLCLDEPGSFDSDRLAPPAAAGSAADLSYVIYTSGSTGQPKGVGISHANVMRLFAATEKWFGFNARDVWTLFHSYAFDFSVWELWGALLYGGRLVIVPHELSRNTHAFRELLIRESVSVLNQTPTAFRQLIDVDRASPPAPFALRYIIFGGEALELQSLKPWIERYGDHPARLINMYGITETTVHVTYRPITRADLDTPRGSLIGEPIPDLRIYLLDPAGHPVPIGVPGEMFVAGAGVAQRGYLNRPELSAQRFLPNPFLTDPAARMYRSGDLARWLAHGELEYLGRIDSQVKIRGFRIELGEIEALLAQHPDVRQVAVIDREDVPAQKQLVAYLVSDAPRPALLEQLRERLRAALPDYMIPAHFLFLNALPLTHNGKLDRRALPAPETTRARDKPFVAPRTTVEQTIANIWQAVLRVERVGLDDHFFELGGDSILSIQVIARCRQQGLQLTPKDLFKRPTIAQLAEVVTSTFASHSASAVVSGRVPLTPIQQWFFEQHFAAAHHWNQAFMLEVSGSFDANTFERALRHVAQHHDALRMRFTQAGDEVTQQYSADATVACQRIDLSHLPTREAAAAITQHAADAQTHFDLARGPLLCAIHFSLGPDVPGRVLLAIHHLVVDGVSWRILREDLETAYFALAAGEVPQLPPKTSSLQAWAERLRDFAQSRAVLQSSQHWCAVTAFEPADLACDGSSATDATPTNPIVSRLSEADTRALLQLPKVFRAQINDVLLCALARSLKRATGASAFRIELEGHGREHIAEDLDVSRTVGWFTTLFPVALEVADDADMLGTLLSVRDHLRQAPHRGLSYGVLRYLGSSGSIRSELSAAPAASIVFNYLGQFDAVVSDSKLFRFAAEATGPWRSPSARRAHAVEIVAVVRAGELTIEWHYDPNRHSETTVSQVAHDMNAALRELLAIGATAPEVPFTSADFPLAQLSRSALERLTARYPRLVDIYPLTSMQRLFFAMETSRSNVGFEQWHFRIDGHMQPSLLRRAVERVIARHPILRTAFVEVGGHQPQQVVCAAATLPWSEEDWRGHTDTERAAALARLLDEDAKQGFEPGEPPLMRVALRRFSDDRWHLVWSTHHLCIDGWSWPALFKDLSHAYAAIESGTEPSSTTTIPFRDYVEWLATAAPDSEQFWRKQLDSINAPTPLRLSEPPVSHATSPVFDESSVTISREATAALEALGRDCRVTLSVVFNAAWALLLSHYNAAPVIVFGAAFSGRPAELRNVESIVGPCVNNLPVRIDVRPSVVVAAWLRELHQQQFDLAQHQYTPLEQIQQWANIPWRYRLFESLVVFQNYQIDPSARTIGRDAQLTLLAAPQATNYPLTLAVEVGEQLRIRLIYQPQQVSELDVRQFAADLVSVLAAIARQPNATLQTVQAILPAQLQGRAIAFTDRKPSVNAARDSVPASEMERIVAQVWEQLFNVERISLDANFFELGGHSLLLVKAHAQLRERLNADLPIVALLQYPTVRALAQHLTHAQSTSQSANSAIDRARKQREAQARQRTLLART